MAKKMWIKDAISKPGSLRKALHIKKGKDIPQTKLDKAAHAKGKLGKRARLAKVLKTFKHHSKKD
jgi:hypothetical protein